MSGAVCGLYKAHKTCTHRGESACLYTGTNTSIHASTRNSQLAILFASHVPHKRQLFNHSILYSLFFFVIFMCSFLRPAREAFSYGYEALFVSVETCARCNRKLLTSFRSIFIQLVLFTQTNTYSNERNCRKPKENRAISTEMYSK